MVDDLANFGFQVIKGGNDILHTVDGVRHVLDSSGNLVKNKVHALKRLLDGKTSSAKEAVILVLVFNLCNALFHKRPDVRDGASETIVRVQDGLRCSGKRVNRRFEAVGDVLARLSNSVNALCEVAQVGFHLLEPAAETIIGGAHRAFQRVCGFHHGLAACINGQADRAIAQTVVLVCQLRADGLYRVRHGLDSFHRKVFGSGDTVGETFYDVTTVALKDFGRGVYAKFSLCFFLDSVRYNLDSIICNVLFANDAFCDAIYDVFANANRIEFRDFFD